MAWIAIRHMRTPNARSAPTREGGVPDELDAVVQRVELGRDLRPFGEPVEREERAGDEEEGREDGADDVAEVLDRGGVARDGDAEASPAIARHEGDARHGQHAPRRVEAEHERDEHRDAAVHPRAHGNPQGFGRDELFSVDGRCEDGVVGPLELVLLELLFAPLTKALLIAPF
jgi:hypothetical protein